MHCAYYESDRCRSCSLIQVPSADRVAAAQSRVDALLSGRWTDLQDPRRWQSPITGPETGFRNKAKMAVSGTADEPTLGILDEDYRGIDLRGCPLYPHEVHTALAHVHRLIRRAQVPPYRVDRRRGELKHVIVTSGDDGALMVRFVVASTKALERLREHLGSYLDSVPGIVCVTANINPEHTSIIEGDEEVHLWGQQWLPVTQGRVRLRARPQSFLQTNTAVASQLYETVANWTDELAARHSGVGKDADPLSVWDLFCGLGGFAAHAALGARTGGPRSVTGVEVAPAAVASARQTAAEAGLDVTVECADAAAWVREQPGRPDMLIVNPPRRGMGEEMSSWVEESGIGNVIYSSCNPRTLASDLARMPGYRVVRARLVDMFPHTPHSEVLTLLGRR